MGVSILPRTGYSGGNEERLFKVEKKQAFTSTSKR
jgi:hypothetical protein